MPYAKDNAKMTGDTHLPDVESDMYDEGSADAVGMDETASDRGEATERGDQKRSEPAAPARPAPSRGAKPRPRGAKVPADARFATVPAIDIRASETIPGRRLSRHCGHRGRAAKYHSG